MVSYFRMFSSFLRPVSIGFLSLAFLGAGCSFSGPSSSPSGDAYGYCMAQTPWGSCIDNNGIDPALLGAWRLESQTLTTPQGTVVNPFAGRVLTFTADTITLVDDVTGVPSTVADLQYFEDWASESSPNASGCTLSGTSGGTWHARGALDLDTNPPTPYYELEITTDPSNPTVTCESGGTAVRSNAASTPLGVGPGSVYTSGLAESQYAYTIADGTLVITKDASGLTNTFVFRR